MRISRFRTPAAFLVGAFILGGCGTSSGGPVSTQAILPSIASGHAVYGNPCSPPKVWHFKGACVVHAMSPVGTTFKLKAINGFSSSVAFQKNNAQSGSLFVVAGGTGPSDITGLLGVKKFPFYGKAGVSCYNKSTQVKCLGKAFLYLQIANFTSSANVTFKTTPKITISGEKGAFPGSKCQLDEMDFPNTGTAIGWKLMRIYGTPVNGTVIFPATWAPISFPSNSFTVFALTCFSK